MSALFVLAAATAQGQDVAAQPIRVGSETIAAACAFAKTNRYAQRDERTAAGILGRFCNLEAPTSAESAEGWATARVPTMVEVETAARGEHLNDTPPARGYRSRQERGPINSAGLSAIGTSFMPDQGTMLVGLAQFAVGRAKDVVSVYTVQAFARRLCNGRAQARTSSVVDLLPPDSVRHFVPATCDLLLSSRANELFGSRYGLPSWGIVQSALRKDLDALPDTVLNRFRTRGAKALAGPGASRDLYQARQRLVASLAAARFASSYLRRQNLPSGFRDAASDIAATLHAVCNSSSGPHEPEAARDCPTKWTSMPVARDLLVATSLLGVVSGSDLRALQDAGKRDTALLLGLKALAVNTEGIDADQEGILRDAWRSYVVASGIQNDSVGGPLFKADKVWMMVGRVVDPLAGLEKLVVSEVAAAGSDRAKRLAVHVSALSQAAPLLVTATDSGPRSAEANRAMALIQRVATYPQLRAEGRYTALLFDLMTLASDVAGSRIDTDFQRLTLPPMAIRALQFAVDASEVKDADAFENLLVSYASPANGFLRKRTRPEGASRFYWSVNMYVGLAYGREWAEDPSLPDRVEARYSGLALPFGPEVGLKTRFGAVTAMFQLIDLGQVASWRSKQEGDTTIKTTPPSLTLASVFAPGVNLMLNLPRYPFAIGIGRARAPEFRDIEPVGEEPRKATVWRTIGFIAVDVPLIP